MVCMCCIKWQTFAIISSLGLHMETFCLDESVSTCPMWHFWGADLFRKTNVRICQGGEMNKLLELFEKILTFSKNRDSLKGWDVFHSVRWWHNPKTKKVTAFYGGRYSLHFGASMGWCLHVLSLDKEYLCSPFYMFLPTACFLLQRVSCNAFWDPDEESM